MGLMYRKKRANERKSNVLRAVRKRVMLTRSRFCISFSILSVLFPFYSLTLALFVTLFLLHLNRFISSAAVAVVHSCISFLCASSERETLHMRRIEGNKSSRGSQNTILLILIRLLSIFNSLLFVSSSCFLLLLQRITCVRITRKGMWFERNCLLSRFSGKKSRSERNDLLRSKNRETVFHT